MILETGAPQPPALHDWPGDLAPLAGGWGPVVGAFLASPAGQALDRQLRARLAAGATVYPPQPWRALALTPPERVKVVILGQDPYHGPGQATGLAFDVPPGVRTPPSLRNIFKELARSHGRPPATGAGLLEHWARQGVLLLNTSLTVEAGQAASHARLGWQTLTDAVLAHLAAHPAPRAYLLWGAHAQARAPRAQPGVPQLVLTANHPSPLSALRPPEPFIGCDHFRKANAFLVAQGQTPVDWLGEHLEDRPAQGAAA